MNTSNERDGFGFKTNKIVITELKSDSGVGNSESEMSLR